MPKKWRMSRINSLLREEIAAVIQHELRDPQLGFVSVMDVRTSPDLKTAVVHVSVLGDDEAAEASLKALERAAPFIRNEVKPHLHMKAMPVISFALDETAANAARISELLKKASQPPQGDEDE